MESCSQKYNQWQTIQAQLEEIERDCSRYEATWGETFRAALANITQPDLFLKALVRSHKEFGGFTACMQERNLLIDTTWIEALEILWECLEEHSHHDIEPA